MSEVTIREATAADYPTFARLFAELGVDDPVPTAKRFGDEVLPTTLIAARDGQPVGYAFFRRIVDTMHLSHLVTAPEARRSGVGRALMTAVANRARDAGCAELQLNVRPTNTAAITLYESFGLARVHDNHGLKIDWAIIDALPEDRVSLAALARPIEPADDASLEAAWRIPNGVLAEQRARSNRVLRFIDSSGGRAAIAVFDLGFPGTYPFRAPDELSALSLLRALRPFAPRDELVCVMIEDQPDLAAALVKTGAKLHLETRLMRGRLDRPD